jgi:hypothetical protein
MEHAQESIGFPSQIQDPPTKNNKRAFILIGLLILLLVGIGGFLIGTFLQNRRESSQKPGKVTVTISPTTIPPTISTASSSADLKTYTNTTYNFELHYPAKGYGPKGKEIECGTIIKNDGKYIYLDNLYMINIIAWDGTITDYITSQNALGLYNVELLTKTGADEAIKLKGLSKTYSGEGYPPLAYVQSMYKKNANLFLFMSAQALMNDGCIPPSALNPSEYPGVDTSWDVTKSVTFL